MRHLSLERLTQIGLAEWAATDAHWWHEAVTVLAAYQEGVAMRHATEQARQGMQA